MTSVIVRFGLYSLFQVLISYPPIETGPEQASHLVSALTNPLSIAPERMRGLNVEPGSYVLVINGFLYRSESYSVYDTGSNVGNDDIANIPPVLGSIIATIPPWAPYFSTPFLSALSEMYWITLSV